MGPSPTFDQFGTSPTPDRGGKRSNPDSRLHITPLHFFFQLRVPIERKLKLAQVHKQSKAKRKKLFISRVLAMATNTQDQQSQAGRHQEVGHKSLLQSDALYQYILETSVYPREPEPMKELRELTAKHPWLILPIVDLIGMSGNRNLMTTSADEGQFLNMLLKLINAKNTMEIGVYTGYSLLATALAIPDDGKILAMDVNRENYELGLPVIQKAGVAHKIDFKEGPALPVLDQLVEDEKNHGSFDFIFVDADKDNYLNYHKRLIELVKVGGLIGYDNTLWNGSVVAPPDAPLRKYVRYYRDFVMELNKALAVDPRIEICMLPVGDGITLCRRVK
ncbi:hypothetical protein Godav_005604 [Gossypium davidsonii]|uniref:Caffeoyl-CoA O-methyltransferase n=4 Tax=Gossypium TaxID=3633 RepID=A0A7J8S2K1_GOSDV|nr:hypothetical protein [Gossypium davidsonii]MBA0655184.1 hypothetical protein [Gossypium klotzschianum]